MAQTFSAVLLLKKKEWLDPSELIHELRLLVEQTGAHVQLDPRSMHQAEKPRGLLSRFSSQKPETIMFELDGVRLRISQVGEPCADERAIHKYINPALWPEGLGEFVAHRAFIRVDEAGIEGEEGPDAIFDRAASVTATASVVARLTSPVGVIWLPAMNAVPMHAFRQGMERLMNGSAPLEMWVRWYALPPGEKEDLNPGAVTNGLGAFSGREIRALPSELQTSDMLDHVFDLAHRMIDDKMTVGDNQTIDLEGDRALKVRMRAPSKPGEPTMCEIDIVEGQAPRRRPVREEPAAPKREVRAPNPNATAEMPERQLRAAASQGAPEIVSLPDERRALSGQIRVIPGGKRSN